MQMTTLLTVTKEILKTNKLYHILHGRDNKISSQKNNAAAWFATSSGRSV